MSMIDPLTLSLVRNALDAGLMRQVAHANNIANAQTPGYRPFAVSFEEGLGDVREALADGRPARLAPQDVPAPRMFEDASAATPPALDAEVAATSANALHYQALARALGQEYSLLSLAISGGSK